MIIKYKDGRQIEIEGFHGVSDDIQIDSAYWVDTGLDVEDDVLDWIYNNGWALEPAYRLIDNPKKGYRWL